MTRRNSYEFRYITNETSMTTTRRTFNAAAAATCVAAAVPTLAAEDSPLIIDTHQHLWDLAKYTPPWLAEAPEVLKHTYSLPQYAEATKGLNVKTVYMEVDVDPKQLVTEAEQVIGLSKQGQPMVGAVIGGRPESA